MDIRTLTNHFQDAPSAFTWKADDVDLSAQSLDVEFAGGAFRCADPGDGELEALVKEYIFRLHGFCILRVADANQYSDEELVEMSHILAGTFGRLLPQTADAQTFYRVQAVVNQERPSYRLSNTSNNTSMHTDCSYGDNRPTAISLFCVNPAVVGGESMICSGYTALESYMSSQEENISPVTRSYLYHRSHKMDDNDCQIGLYPMLNSVNGILSFRYKWPYIQLGHDKAGVTLRDDEQQFFDAFEHLVNKNDFVLRYALKRGECLVGNNLWVFHNRAVFKDVEGKPRRLLMRHWMDAKP